MKGKRKNKSPEERDMIEGSKQATQQNNRKTGMKR